MSIQHKNQPKITIFAAILIFFISVILNLKIIFASSSTEITASTSSSSSAVNTLESSSTPPINSLDAERKALEAQLADLEKQIEEQQQKIKEYQKQGKTLQGEISLINSKINQLNLQIKAVNLKLEQLSDSVSETQKQIQQIEDQINTNKKALASALQIIYENDNQNLLEILLSNNNLSDFFTKLDNIVLVQSSMKNTLSQIQQLRDQLIIQQQTLENEMEETQNFKNIQLAQKQSLQQTQSYKNTLLKETKGQEANYQKLLAKTKETAAQIRNRIFQLLGGGQLTFQQAYNYAKLAEGATGVRAALILAVLDRESALGKNVGKCPYQTAMHPTRDVPIFLKLLDDLHIDPNSQAAYVSCPNQHGTYGGAMGPAQFLPSTWMLYADKVSQITGNKPANPWNNSDAFVATGLLLKDLLNSQSCISYSQQIPSQSQDLLERCAAAKYYAGNNWYTYRFWYGQPVVDRADKFEQDIKTMLGNS